MTAVTVRDLADSPLLRHSTRLGDDRGLAAEVSNVVLAELGQAFPEAAPGTVVVLALQRHQSVDAAVDVTLRRARSWSVPAVVLAGATVLPLATRRLAARLALPVFVVAADVSTLSLMAELRDLVHAPDLHESTLLLGLADELTAVRGLDDLVEALRHQHDGGAVAVVTADGRVHGDLGDLTIERVTDVRSTRTVLAQGRVYLVHPLVTHGDAGGWIVLETAHGTARQLDRCRRLAALAAGPALGTVAREMVRRERHARERARVLAEVLHAPEQVGPDLAAAAADAGLALAGWHVGIHLRAPTSRLSGPLLADLESAVQREVPEIGPFVDRTDGWAAWLSQDAMPDPGRIRDFTGAVVRALGAATSQSLGDQISLGVGAPGRDAAGIALTLAQARQAALVASTSAPDDKVRVRVVQDLGASRLLLGWYGSGAFRDLADEMLVPLTALGDPDLVTTLAAYLDRACSASHTARYLGIHRNTVNQRISKAERVLSVSLTDPDTRLALQLALRAHRTPATTSD